MKPDKHKQKVSSQYKKKHGLSDGSDKKAGGGAGGGRGRGGGSRGGRPAAERDRSQEQVQECRPYSYSSSREHGQESGASYVEISEKSTFKRREIISNWERYEGFDNSVHEADIQRGADIKTLIDGSSGAFAQFRFQHEKDWDMGNDDLGCTDFLAVDSDDLIKAMSCIPLHERLNIESSAFEEETLKTFEDEAAHNTLELNRSHLLLKESEIPQTKKVNVAAGVSDILTQVSSISTGMEKPTVTPPDFLDDVLGIESLDNNLLCVNEVTKRVSENTQEIDALDELLDNNIRVSDDKPDLLERSKCDIEQHNVLDETTDSQNGSEKDKGVAQKELSACQNTENSVKTKDRQTPNNLPNVNMEDELDFLLSLDDKFSIQEESGIRQHSVDSHKLDDWLDSVLED